VLCLSTKVVSKAAGLVIPPEDKQRAIAASTVRLVARRHGARTTTSVVEIPAGPVMAAAGIDASNSPDGLLLLPEDPDAAAAHLLEGITALTGRRIGLVLTDTSSRIWRVGVGDIALGAAGVTALEDLRGTADADGRVLHVTVRALADALAAAADLVKGKADGVPAAIVRGLGHAVVPAQDAVSARELSRTGSGDWFRRPSLESVWQALGLPLEEEPVAAVAPEEDAVRIARAVTVANAAGQVARAGADAEAAPEPDADADAPESAPHAQVEAADLVVVTAGGEGPAALLEAGACAQRVRVALGAESIARELPPVRVLVRLADGQEVAR
jgi:coenzyme F420-0:L-glutamate ligase/coenzyme F420-1:gamma-L-glutamate ligase